MKRSPTFTVNQMDTLEHISLLGWTPSLDRRSVAALHRKGCIMYGSEDLPPGAPIVYLVTEFGNKVLARRKRRIERRKQ